MTQRVRFPAKIAVLALLALLAIVFMPGVAQAQPPEPHTYINDYQGPATCRVCHGNIANDVVHSVHYTWGGQLDRYNLVAGSNARINWLGMLSEKLEIAGGCGRCHIGSGNLPSLPGETVSREDSEGIDCLICHSPGYDVSLRFPVQTEDGTWQLTQDRRLLAARQAQRPLTENCVRCHQNVGGGPASPSEIPFASDTHGEGSKPDVHMDAGMTCVDCHAALEHKVLGSSPNLAGEDLPDHTLSCESCHSDKPHANSILDNQHTRLDCRTCHITGTGGLTARDWTTPARLDPITGLYQPTDTTSAANSVQPALLWFDGKKAGNDGMISGSPADLAAQLQPFKLLRATVPVDARSNEPIPLKLETFYQTGDLDAAVKKGALEAEMDYSGQWTTATFTTTIQLSHGVGSKEQARGCQECHVPNGLVDFAAMGYNADEVGLLSSISSPDAGQRRPLQLAVVIPAAQPLPTPAVVSTGVEAYRGIGIRIPWKPIPIVLVSGLILAAGGFWLYRQRPANSKP
ncbi:MAG: cytochrome c3 family protein [Caldilineales bacterium]